VVVAFAWSSVHLSLLISGSVGGTLVVVEMEDDLHLPLIRTLHCSVWNLRSQLLTDFESSPEKLSPITNKINHYNITLPVKALLHN
jgi:hypothetical protein